MAKKDKYDGAIEAVHLDADGKVEWVRAYLRRGVVFSDRTILTRKELVEALMSGMKFYIGERVQYKGNDFEIAEPVYLVQSDDQNYVAVGKTETDHDNFSGVPVL